jgi:hypothetical protein
LGYILLRRSKPRFLPLHAIGKMKHTWHGDSIRTNLIFAVISCV